MTVDVKIREGRKHEVKRLLAWAGAPVQQLTRISFADINIGRLAPGACRNLRKNEIAALRHLTGLPVQRLSPAEQKIDDDSG